MNLVYSVMNSCAVIEVQVAAVIDYTVYLTSQVCQGPRSGGVIRKSRNPGGRVGGGSQKVSKHLGFRRVFNTVSRVGLEGFRNDHNRKSRRRMCMHARKPVHACGFGCEICAQRLSRIPNLVEKFRSTVSLGGHFPKFPPDLEREAHAKPPGLPSSC